MPVAPLAERSRLSAPERRTTIMRAAGPLFARHGYAATRLDDVAAAAGVTKPVVYRHFESKKALYMALLVKHRDDLPTFVAGGEVPIRAILDGWLDYARENQHAWEMLFRDGSGDEDIRILRTEVSRRARQVMAAFIADRAGKRLPPEQIEPTADMLTNGLAALVLWWIDHPAVPKSVLIDVAMRMSAPAVAN